MIDQPSATFHYGHSTDLLGFLVARIEDAPLTQRATVSAGATVPERPEDIADVSGGQDLWSTLDDYCASARMFVGGGTVDGVRLLRPETLAKTASNQLTPEQRENATLLGLPLFVSGHGYGMGVAVVMEPEHAEPTICGGGVGAVAWSGGFGGW